MSSTNGKKSKKPAITPEAAKILEQYRNSGSKPTESGEPGAAGGGPSTPAQRPTGPLSSNTMRRSGTRGK